MAGERRSPHRASPDAATPGRMEGGPGPWRLHPEPLALLLALYLALACNLPYWHAVLAGRDPAAPATWRFAVAAFAMLVAAEYLLVAPLLQRRVGKPLLSLLLLATAFATYYMQRYGVFLDPSMLRNVLRTEAKEARELLAPSLLPHLLLNAALPIAVLWRVRLAPRPLARGVLLRGASLLAALGLGAGALMLVFQDYSALMRNQREVRYLITPWNFLYSAARVLTDDAAAAHRPRQVVGADARPGSAAQGRLKPALLLLVVGETARAANWGLGGYARQTTPALAAAGVINFPVMHACGTNTEVSVPCMFSAIGRRDYDERRIHGSESLLHVLARAGYGIVWRDNQTGCKGVCAGLGEERLDPRRVRPGLCEGGECLDEALLDGLDGLVRDRHGNLVVVLHMLGNHGPAYFRRYPPAFRRWAPTCDTLELRECTPEQITNSYDNALLYTDHVLARAIDFLHGQQSRFDTALVYVSDHGESLGEKGLYLHGMPYAIAPSEQTRVPMVWWLSPGFLRSAELDRGCLERRAAQPASHDHLFHSVLGLLDVQTAAHEAAWDLTAACRRPAA